MVKIYRGINLEESQEGKYSIETFCGLWEADWLFNEVLSLDKEKWKEEIQRKCISISETLKSRQTLSGDLWNFMFMQLYIDYIICGLFKRSTVQRINECQRLMCRWKELADERENDPALYVLAGKISCLSSTENKYAVYYYQNAVAYEERADIYYNIGHIYEKAYGDNEKALYNYKKACECDPNYYKALYKLAVDKEKRKNWMGALLSFSRIRNIIGRRRRYGSISICEFEYEYKSCKRILNIYKENVDDAYAINYYREILNDMSQCIEEYFHVKRNVKEIETLWNKMEEEKQKYIGDIELYRSQMERYKKLMQIGRKKLNKKDERIREYINLRKIVGIMFRDGDRQCDEIYEVLHERLKSDCLK